MMVKTFLPLRAGSIEVGSLDKAYFTQTVVEEWFHTRPQLPQSSLVVDAPVDRTQAFVDEIVFEEAVEKCR